VTVDLSCTVVPVATSDKNGSAPQIDAVSKAIIEQLQDDGRRPYAAIGKAVGLSGDCYPDRFLGDLLFSLCREPVECLLVGDAHSGVDIVIALLDYFLREGFRGAPINESSFASSTARGK